MSAGQLYTNINATNWALRKTLKYKLELNYWPCLNSISWSKRGQLMLARVISIDSWQNTITELRFQNKESILVVVAYLRPVQQLQMPDREQGGFNKAN